MIGRFYGLSGINLILSPMSFSTFKSLVTRLDTFANRSILSSLKRELEEMIKFIDKLPLTYADPNLAKKESYVRMNKYQGKELEEVKAELERSEKVLSRSILTRTSKVVSMSDGALALLGKLANNRDRAVKFCESIKYSNENSGASVFGEKLYLLRKRSEPYIINKMAEAYKNSFSLGHERASLENLRQDVATLDAYSKVSDSDLTPRTLSDGVDSIINRMDYTYFNNVLDLDLNEKEYYDLTLELRKIGLHGFSVYTKQFYNEFLNSTSQDLDSDISISKERTQGLFNIKEHLERVLSNFEKRFGEEL